MMRPRLAAIALLVASAAGAQTNIDVGVQAYLRGDYGAAFEILRPIAESWPSRDQAAEFFVATLYQNGRGVAADSTRACALYVRASSDPSTPIGRQAQELFQAMRPFLTPAAFRECVTLANIGFDHGFQPVTFALEPGHWIALDLDGATITFKGEEKRIALGLAAAGMRFLPIEHTELAVGGAEPARRHFIEVFTWTPARDGQWTLLWRVFEVVRDALTPVTTAPLITVSAGRSSLPSIDVHELARLRVDDGGRAEWAVLGGPNPRTGPITSEAERRTEAERARARAAADAAVDWTTVRDIQRVPQLIYVDGDGCGRVFVYGTSADRSEAISIRADQDALGLSTTPRTFEIAERRSNLRLTVHVFDRARRSWSFCTDVGTPDNEKATWDAVSGTVTIELSPAGIDPRIPSAYRATIHLAGAEFVSARGVRVKQPRPITLSAIVGFFAGG